MSSLDFDIHEGGRWALIVDSSKRVWDIPTGRRHNALENESHRKSENALCVLGIPVAVITFCRISAPPIVTAIGEPPLSDLCGRGELVDTT